MVVTEILPSDTYRISQLEPSNSLHYSTKDRVSQLKAWRNWNEDDDDSSTNSDDEPEMQRLKRTARNQSIGQYSLDSFSNPPTNRRLEETVAIDWSRMMKLKAS
ncbi:hypothetical protein AVEN_132053-1 [Araneus ventricosus]|uniref:Uncharacterized protein n=1 Tax=Araneus ventricosus TaxID=182803 RepID=A0A4Y2T922_ARAVE|nr:hypothetical protein AVEN_8600-1 [Araneus ventricosus]GBN97138.1 hypothetical protein AVEN_132053-1 [Araneus ventricosus]